MPFNYSFMPHTQHKTSLRIYQIPGSSKMKNILCVLLKHLFPAKITMHTTDTLSHRVSLIVIDEAPVHEIGALIHYQWQRHSHFFLHIAAFLFCPLSLLPFEAGFHCSPGCLQTHRPSASVSPSAGITWVHHHTQICFAFYMENPEKALTWTEWFFWP